MELIKNQVITAFYPDSIVLDKQLNVVSIYGNAGRYLLWPQGKLEHNFGRLLRPDLKNKLLALGLAASRAGKRSKTQTFDFGEGEDQQKIEARLHSLDVFDESILIIGFISKKLTPFERRDSEERNAETSELEQELHATREHLQSVIEEHETSSEELQALNEEMQSSNEELQSTNEELQSTNEELETSNEELQSTNEELTTLNQELSVRTSELSELSNNLEAILRCVKSPIFVIDSNFNLVRCNPDAIELFHLGNNILNKNLRLLDSDRDLRLLFDTIEVCLKTSMKQSATYTTDLFNYNLFCEPILSSDGQAKGVVATLVDNTELASSFRESESSKRTMFEILEGIPAKVSVKNAEGRYTFVNATFCRAVNLEPHQILKKLDRDIFGAEEGSKRRERDFACLQSGKPTYFDEVHRSEDRKVERIFYTVRVPLAENDGSFGSICSVGIDISGRAIVEKSLREFQKTISSLDDCFIMLSDHGESMSVSFCSEAISKLCGINSKDLESRDFSLLLKAFAPSLSQSEIENYIQLLRGERRSNTKLQVSRGGEEFYYDFRWNRIELGSHVRVFLTLIDITQEHKYAANLKLQEEDFSRAGKLAALGEMAAGIAHELKTPLNTIQGYIDLINGLKMQDIPVAEPVMDAITNIEQTVATISEVIAGLKSIARTGEEGHFARHNLHDVLSDVVKISAFHVKNKGIQFRYDIPADIEIEVNATQLKQVIINLINNAVDAVRNLPEKWIDISVNISDEIVSIRVTDSGHGIPKSVAKRLMTPFFTTKKTGTGLGLSLSKNILAAHNGSLEIDEENSNTSFLVSLPRKQVTRQHPVN